MKKAVFITLLLALAFRPIYHLSYIVYYECNIDYIIEKYCVNKEEPTLQCNGKCHLAKKISIDDNLTDTTPKGIQSFAEAFFPVYQEKEYNYSLKPLLLSEKAKHNWKLALLHPFNFICRLERPPDFVV